MSRADTKNAHVRQNQPKQEAAETAADSAHLLDHPGFKAAYGRVHDELVKALDEFQSDGSPESDAYEREVCRSLRTLSRVKRYLSRAVQGHELRIADFKPRDPSETD